MLHNKPIHSISVNGKYYDVAVEKGTEITFRAVVTDAGADLTTHAIEVMHPNGTMSYDGWLTGGDWGSDSPDNGSMSVKTAYVTVVDEGKNAFSDLVLSGVINQIFCIYFDLLALFNNLLTAHYHSKDFDSRITENLLCDSFI